MLFFLSPFSFSSCPHLPLSRSLVGKKAMYSSGLAWSLRRAHITRTQPSSDDPFLNPFPPAVRPTPPHVHNVATLCILPRVHVARLCALPPVSERRRRDGRVRNGSSLNEVEGRAMPGTEQASGREHVGSCFAVRLAASTTYPHPAPSHPPSYAYMRTLDIGRRALLHRCLLLVA